MAVIGIVISGLNLISTKNGSIPVFDILLFMDELKNNPSHYKFWWVYIMLFSTLLPTVLHYIVVIMALGSRLTFPRKRQYHAIALKEFDDEKPNPIILQKAAHFIVWKQGRFFLIGISSVVGIGLVWFPLLMIKYVPGLVLNWFMLIIN